MSPATDHVDVTTASKAGSDSSQPSHRPETSGISSQPAKRSFSTSFDLSRRESSSSDSNSESVTSDRPPVDLYPEEGELSDDHEVSLTDPDQSLSEEQSYRETMRGIQSYMGWTHVPDLDSGTKTSDDNPFAGPKLQNPGKVFVNLPTDEWLCNKLSKLNITLVQGYPSRTTEAGTLQRDQFVHPAKSQSKWYGVHSETKKDSGSTLKSWNTSSSRINSTYLRIARQAGIASNPPLSRPISQENLRKWERSARESSIICNQAAGFNRCVLKVHQNMHTQLRTIRTESKGKAASKVSAATDKLQFLLDFNSSVCQAMAKAMEHLTDFVFVNMANTTLLRRDSYLSYLKAGVKADTLNALRSAPLELHCSRTQLSSKQRRILLILTEIALGRFTRRADITPMRGRIGSLTLRNRTDRPGKMFLLTASIDEGRENTSIPHDQPRASSRINDNYCVTNLQARLLAGSTHKKTLTFQDTVVNLNVVNHALSATGHPQRKGISPGLAVVRNRDHTFKFVKGASCVTQLSCVQPVVNVLLVAKTLPVGSRLQNFWQTWLDLGAGPKIVQILREGYTLPCRTRPTLTRSPTVISRYVNPHRNSYLLEALHQLIDKNAVELVHNQTSLGFFNRLFLVPKPNNKWRPILDLSNLNFFLKVGKFKMETPETIRTSLQQGEWVISVDFKDAYFHIPIRNNPGNI